MKVLYRIDEAGEMLGFKRTKVYEWVRSGALRVVHVDGVTRVPASAISEFVERLEAEALSNLH